MFLFRWIWQIFGLVLGAIILPLRLLGISALLWRPIRALLKFCVKRPVPAGLIAIAIALFFHFRHNNERLPELTPASGAPRAVSGKLPIIDPVLKKEDGDSSFATDLYALMTEQERIDYSKNFYWAMSSMKNGQTHGWTSNNIAGSLRPNDTFQNSYGDRCRHFSEALKVHTIQQTISGIACEQGGGRWCKLGPNATPLCGISKSSGGIMNSFSRTLGGLF